MNILSYILRALSEQLDHHTCLSVDTLLTLAEEDYDLLYKYDARCADILYADFNMTATEFEYAVAVHDIQVDEFNTPHIFRKDTIFRGMIDYSDRVIWRAHKRCYDAAARLRTVAWGAQVGSND